MSITKTLEGILRPFQMVKTAVSVADADAPDMPLVYVNESFETLTGYQKQDVIGRNCRFLQGADTDPEAHLLIRNALQDRREISICLMNYTIDHRSFHNLLILSPVKSHTGARFILGCQYELKHGLQRPEIEEHLKNVDGVINQLTHHEMPQEPWRQSLKSYQQRSDSVKMLALNYLQRL